MKLKHRTQEQEKSKSARLEPMAEGPILKSKQRGWSHMSDEEIVVFATGFIKKEGISSKKQFREADRSLYGILERRKLTDKICLENQKRAWSNIDDEAVIGEISGIAIERGIHTRKGLEDIDGGLCAVIERRGLWKRALEEIAHRADESGGHQTTDGISTHGRDTRKTRYSGMTDDDIIRMAREHILRNGIHGRDELHKSDQGLYSKLYRRNLQDSVGLERKNSSWTDVSDDEIIRNARELIAERKISMRVELNRADPKLFNALRQRNLLGYIGLESKHSENRDWAGMSRDEIIDVAKEIIERKNITGRKGLEREDPSLYKVLNKRRLLEEVGLSKKVRDWLAMSDQELAEYSREFIQERGIETTTQLVDADNGLYQKLIERGLIDSVGLERRRQPLREWASMGDDELIGIAKEVISERCVRSRTDLKQADSGLFEVLRKRELTDAVGLENRRGEMRDWTSVGDDELVSLARSMILEIGIEVRDGLKKADAGLFATLYRRGLLDSAFSEKSKDEHAQAVNDVLEALGSFGGND